MRLKYLTLLLVMWVTLLCEQPVDDSMITYLSIEGSAFSNQFALLHKLQTKDLYWIYGSQTHDGHSLLLCLGRACSLMDASNGFLAHTFVSPYTVTFDLEMWSARPRVGYCTV